MSDEIKKQRYYIYENIHKLKNQNQIIDLITHKNCKFTENNNGIFLNISVLEDDIINISYKIIINSLIYEKETTNYVLQKTDMQQTDIQKTDIQKTDEIILTKVVKNKKKLKKNNIPLKNFKKKEQEIIKYSKKYNL